MKRTLFFIPAALYYAFIFYLSSRSHDIKIDIIFFDKVIHIVEFALLGLLLSFGYFMSLKSPLMIKAVLTICSGILLGGLDEFHQYFIPRRSVEFFDVIADAIGILTGLLLYYYFSRSAKGKIFAEKLSKAWP
jgi:VanZ family protein